MSIIQGNTKISAGGYTIDQSIRFDRATSSALYRTQGTPDGTSWTLSFWIKRGQLRNGSGEEWFINGGAAYPDYIRFESNDKIRFRIFSRSIDNTTTAVFRDPSAWYHFVANWNGSTGAYNLWQNNVSLISGTGSSGETYYNKSGQLFNIGRDGGGSNYFDGYFAEIVKLDNTVADPTSFGEYNDDGVWVPIDVSSLTFGSEGFYIKGQDSSNLGDDSSGNTNDFTSSGLASDDQMLDTPTNNYGTLSPLTGSGSVTYADGNLQATQTANYVGSFGTLAVNSGKYYFEYSYAADGNYSDGRLLGGVVCVETADHGHFRIDGGSFYYPDKTTEGNYMVFHRSGNGQQSNTGTSTSAYNTNLSSSSATGGPESGPDIYMVAMDLDNNNLYWGKNGTWYGASSTSGSDYTDATPIAILSAHQGKYFAPAFYWTGAASGTTTVLNCGQDATFGGRYSSPAGDFYYTPPTGFSKLSTSNLATPAITDGSAYFQTSLYTGTGSSLAVNQSGNSVFQPDFVWIKKRSGADRHELEDAVRGATKRLSSDRADAEDTGGLTSFDSDGFTVDGLYGSSGESGFTYAAWQWLAANGTASNTDGSITSTVSANTTAGFSIVSYNGNGISGATVGHGLGIAPSTIIIFDRSGTANPWVWHTGLSGVSYYIQLNSSNAELSTPGSGYFTAVSSSTLTLTQGTSGTYPLANLNASGTAYVLYCFAEVEGFSKFGSYTGNGSSDGPFVWCGFRPAFVLIKNASSAANWKMFDSAREPSNLVGAYLEPNTTAAEANLGGGNTTDLDFVSNGFKIRGNASTINTSGNSHIFMAFAEHPFGGDGVAPVPAR